jgi:hypothetical protein
MRYLLDIEERVLHFLAGFDASVPVGATELEDFPS